MQKFELDKKNKRKQQPSSSSDDKVDDSLPQISKMNDLPLFHINKGNLNLNEHTGKSTQTLNDEKDMENNSLFEKNINLNSGLNYYKIVNYTNKSDSHCNEKKIRGENIIKNIKHRNFVPKSTFLHRETISKKEDNTKIITIEKTNNFILGNNKDINNNIYNNLNDIKNNNLYCDPQEYNLIINQNIYNYNYVNSSNKKKFRNQSDLFKSLYKIDIENIVYGYDKRTTIMIRHIPNKYNYQDLLVELNLFCKGKFDFLYLPLDLKNYCNLGYAFINFINPLHIIYFFATFKSRKWFLYNSFKECDLCFAKYQGKEELMNIMKNYWKSQDKNRLPILFKIENTPKIDIFKEYYDIICKNWPEIINDINWI
jgi:hypothetical protein